MSWQRWKHLILPMDQRPDSPERIEAGLYHFQLERDGQYLRLHLRVDRSGQSLLIANASEAVRFSWVGTIICLALLEGNHQRDIVKLLKIPQGEQLVQSVRETLDQIGRPDQRFPIFNLADPSFESAAGGLLAPFQADVEMANESTLRKIVDRLWQAGIPHIRLFCQAPADLESLSVVVEHAEDVGMITGVRCLASHLIASEQLPKLAQAGLDYVVVPAATRRDDHARWYGADDHENLAPLLAQCDELLIAAVAEVPLLAGSLEAIDDESSDLLPLGLRHFEVFALVDESDVADSNQAAAHRALVQPPALRQLAAWVEDLSNKHQAQIVWLPPRPISGAPADLESLSRWVRQGPRAGGDVTIRVRGDGSVIPPRGPAEACGNLLADPWDVIWNHRRFSHYRDELIQAEPCDQCTGMAICVSGCPADPTTWAPYPSRNESK